MLQVFSQMCFWGWLADISNTITILEQAINYKTIRQDFAGGAVVKNLPAKAGDTGSIPGPGRSHMLRSN